MSNIVSKCDICGREIQSAEIKYTNSKNKCILHCDKDNWFITNGNCKDWSNSKDEIKFFWKQIRNLIVQVFDKEKEILDFKYTIFPQFEYIHHLDSKIISFNHELANKEFNFLKYELEGLSSYGKEPEFIIDVSIDFTNSTFLDDVSFNYYKFKKFICFNKVKFHGKCKFKNTEINEVSFDDVKFFKSVIFENSILNLINYQEEEDFKNTIFYDDLNIHTSKFSTIESKKAYDIKFMGTQFKRVCIMGCDFEKGICFFRDTKADLIFINGSIINFLYIESDVPTISITGNKEIHKLTIKHNTLQSLTIHNTVIKKDFLLNKEQYKKRDEFKLGLLNLKESTFEGKVKIQFYEITKADFYNTKFKELADFYQTTFYEVDFKRTDFWNISVFSESNFDCDVDFSYVKFWGKAIFRDTIISGTLNLRDSIFKDEANFLNITKEKVAKDKEPIDITVANRETARVIKNFYDNSNNIIESNRFYKLEMIEREKELSKNKWSNPKEWLVFKFHELSSNHSQDWFLSLLWIFSISFLYISILEVCREEYIINEKIFYIIINSLSFLLLFELFSKDRKVKIVFKYLYVFIVQFGVFIITNKDFHLITSLNEIADKINPFSIMSSWDEISIDLLLFKVIVAYLIYQLIISIRQNTRRK